MTERRPGRWPVDEPADLDALGAAEPNLDELYMQRQKERALHEMVLDSIRHDLEQQPSPVCVLTAARDWCSRITAAAEDIARTKRKTA
ncbi:hypothetical protein SAMN05216532_3983 [Streptomyces sp. 2231.1]|uniref:hypothetical protein n=1 Tax=Streptomyces sp. 2231.1 TaxID=1855347 RepID=UPI00089CE53B|nr:hypothetical protein [Streptomyces sp. 2231.1]SED26101.1 hypothetical protein SAMN05216532_3983 [Streptomyces sp. 2231.1]